MQNGKRTSGVLLAIGPCSPSESSGLPRREPTLLLDCILNGSTNNLGGVVQITEVRQTSLTPELHVADGLRKRGLDERECISRGFSQLRRKSEATHATSTG